MKVCDYGCGNEALYYLKRAQKWCCSKSYNSCPISKEKNRKSHIGEKNHRYGKTNSEESKRKTSESNKGNIPWNKGKTNIYSNETLEKMREARLDQVSWNKGLPHSKETKRKISEKLKGNVPWNKGISQSKETKNKISIANSGRKRSKTFKQNQSNRIKHNKNPKWKGGYHSSNIPLYDTFYNKLTIEENPKRDIIDQNILTVICANSSCNKRFIPKLTVVVDRIRCLNGTNHGESRIYCSEECKISCSIFNRKIYQEGHPKSTNMNNYTQEEYDAFREFVLKRDNNMCQYCGDTATDVHHERPQKLEPFFSLDPDFAWSCCEKCHYEKGHRDECSTGKLASKIC